MRLEFLIYELHFEYYFEEEGFNTIIAGWKLLLEGFIDFV